MHIADGILSLPVVAGGFAASFTITWYCLKRIKDAGDPRERIPRAALLTAAFFVASLIHVPLPPASVHLVLNGLIGILLGAFAFPAILVGLFFQAVMFGHGGLSTLGVNSLILGIPALLVGWLFHLNRRPDESFPRTIGRGLLAGSGAVFGATMLLIGALLVGFQIEHQQEITATAIITILAVAYLPLIVLEGVITALLVGFLQRVKPTILQWK